MAALPMAALPMAALPMAALVDSQKGEGG